MTQVKRTEPTFIVLTKGDEKAVYHASTALDKNGKLTQKLVDAGFTEFKRIRVDIPSLDGGMLESLIPDEKKRTAFVQRTVMNEIRTKLILKAKSKSVPMSERYKAVNLFNETKAERTGKTAKQKAAEKRIQTLRDKLSKAEKDAEGATS